MIKGIAGGLGVHVIGGSTSTPYINSNNASAGMVRYHNGNLEVYDGHAWLLLGSNYVTIELTQDIHDVLHWAREKRDEEYRIKTLIKDNPTLAAAHDAVLLAKEQFDMLEALIKDHDI